MVVVLAVALIAALPVAVHLVPAGSSSVTAQTLLARIRSSAGVGFSGYAQSQGGLDLPVSTDDLTATSDLLGGTHQLRVWWRGDQDWRVDDLSLTGESDLHADRAGTWTWDYESVTARRTEQGAPQVRVPRSEDLLPGALARRLLSEAPASSATRIASVRVAGRSAAGLRVTINDRRSTIKHIDVWALPGDGLPLKVSVYGGADRAVVTTSLLDVRLGAPASSVVGFHPAAGVRVQRPSSGDLVSAVDNFGRSRPPGSVAGLTRRTDLELGAVGIYGSGATELAALPLSSSLARQVVPSLVAADTGSGTTGVSVSAGAVNLQLSPPTRFGNRWLLVGTVTPATMRAALAELPEPRVAQRHRRHR